MSLSEIPSTWCPHYLTTQEVDSIFKTISRCEAFSVFVCLPHPRVNEMQTVLYDKLSDIKANMEDTTRSESIRDAGYFCWAVLSYKAVDFNLNVVLTVLAYVCLSVIFNKLLASLRFELCK